MIMTVNSLFFFFALFISILNRSKIMEILLIIHKLETHYNNDEWEISVDLSRIVIEENLNKNRNKL